MNTTKLSKTTRFLKVTTVLTTLFGWAGSLFAAATIWVDMDLGTIGIQNTRIVIPGQAFQIGLVLDIDASGLSAYNLSVSYDTAELTATAAASMAPPGMTVTPGPVIAPPLVRLFGAIENSPGSGPVSMNMIPIGTIDFTVPLAAVDGNVLLADVIPGLSDAGFDVFADGSAVEFTPTFNPGFVTIVPEPGTWALFVCGTIAALTVMRHRRAR